MIYPTIGLSRRLEREESGYGRCNIDVQRDRGATGGGCAARSGGSSPFAPWCQGAEDWILDNRPGAGPAIVDPSLGERRRHVRSYAIGDGRCQTSAGRGRPESAAALA